MAQILNLLNLFNSSCTMEQEFHHGDKVNLVIDQEVVAIGRVHAIQPDDTSHGEMLGVGLLSVSIDKCLYVKEYFHFQKLMHARFVKLLVALQNGTCKMY